MFVHSRKAAENNLRRIFNFDCEWIEVGAETKAGGVEENSSEKWLL